MAPHAPDVPVFHPTLKEMEAGLEAYVSRIERRAGGAGLAKIVPPKGWTPRKAGYGGGWDVPIQRPIRQHATGTRGLYRTLLIETRPLTGNGTFKAAALAEEAVLPPAERLPTAAEARADPAALGAALAARERRFWRSVTLTPPVYGADVPGSLWDPPRAGRANGAVDGWNPARLDSLLSRALAGAGAAIPGVSTAYLYFGMWRSIFAWHTEDMDLVRRRGEGGRGGVGSARARSARPSRAHPALHLPSSFSSGFRELPALRCAQALVRHPALRARPLRDAHARPPP